MKKTMRARSRRPPAPAGLRHPLHGAGGGDPTLVKAFATNWRFWARLPLEITAVLLLSKYGKSGKDQMKAVIGRPTFPRGVCTGCGCSENDACVVGEDFMSDAPIGCHWIDEKQTRCSACGPAAPVSKTAKKR